MTTIETPAKLSVAEQRAKMRSLKAKSGGRPSIIGPQIAEFLASGEPYIEMAFDTYGKASNFVVGATKYRKTHNLKMDIERADKLVTIYNLSVAAVLS